MTPSLTAYARRCGRVKRLESPYLYIEDVLERIDDGLQAKVVER